MEELNLRDSLGIGKTKFGIEIEFSKASLNSIKRKIENGGFTKSIYNDPKYSNWFVVKDNSVTKIANMNLIGGEVVSPIMVDNKKYYHDIYRVCTTISRNGGIASNDTAAHIHIDADIIENNPKYLCNLLKLWIAYEDIIFKFGYNGCKARENIISFALPIYPYICELYKVERAYSNLEILDILSDDRNNAINFLNYKKNCKLNNNYKNTIEIRCPNGTLDPVVWQNNINFFIKLILYAKKDEFDDKFIEHVISQYEYPNYFSEAYTKYGKINDDKAVELSNLIFDNEIDKTYFLKQYRR